MTSLRVLLRPGIVLGLLICVLASGLWYAREHRESATASAASVKMRAPLASASAVCPDPVAGRGSVTTIAAATGRAGQAGGDVGDVAVTTDLSAPRSPLERLGPYGTTLQVPVTPAASGRPVVVRASGGAAPGLAAAQFTRTLSGELRGLAAARCAEPGTEFWFLGSSTLVGERSRLYLSNPTPAPALVELMVYGDRGVVPLPGGRQVAVPAGAQRVVALDAFAPDLALLGVHVQVKEGRIAAALRDQRLDGLVPEGVDWLPAAEPPAKRIVVPGIAGLAGIRTLQLLVPGATDAIARVRLVSEDGTSVPPRLDVVQATARSVTQIDLTGLADHASYALELVSDVPITAGVRIRGDPGPGGVSDFGYTAAAPALDGPAVVPYVQVGRTDTALLMLSASGPRAEVEVAFLSRYPGGPPPPEPVSLDVAAGATALVRLPTAASSGAYGIRVITLSGGDQLRGGLLQSEQTRTGAIFTLQPLVPVLEEVAVPAVTPDLGAALP